MLLVGVFIGIGSGAKIQCEQEKLSYVAGEHYLFWSWHGLVRFYALGSQQCFDL